MYELFEVVGTGMYVVAMFGVLLVRGSCVAIAMVVVAVVVAVVAVL